MFFYKKTSFNKILIKKYVIFIKKEFFQLTHLAFSFRFLLRSKYSFQRPATILEAARQTSHRQAVYIASQHGGFIAYQSQASNIREEKLIASDGDFVTTSIFVT